uniref:Uncharacterized protein n=1 Tax=viral metagenome TaxID=1070528 RepID=A0A6C0JJ42_9ZZZZ
MPSSNEENNRPKLLVSTDVVLKQRSLKAKEKPRLTQNELELFGNSEKLKGWCQSPKHRNSVNCRVANMQASLNTQTEEIVEIKKMMRAMLPAIKEIRDTGEGGREDMSVIRDTVIKGAEEVKTLLLRRLPEVRPDSYSHYILLYYKTLYTLFRLGCQLIWSLQTSVGSVLSAIPIVGWLLMLCLYLCMFVLLLMLQETGLFFGSFGLLHYFGHNRSIYKVILTVGWRLTVVLGGSLFTHFRRFITPYMEDTFEVMRDESGITRESLGVKLNETMSAVGSFVKNKTDVQVRQIVDDSISATLGRIKPVVNVSGVLAGISEKTGVVASAAASGASAVASGVASGAASGASAVATGASAVASGVASGASSAAEAARAAAARAAAAATGKWFGGGVITLDYFKEFDDINILNGSQLAAFNKSKLGKILVNLQIHMDNTIVNNLNKNKDKKINKTVVNSFEKIVIGILTQGVPYFVKEMNVAIPLYKYVKDNKVQMKNNNEYIDSLCSMDIVKFYEQNKIRGQNKSKTHKKVVNTRKHRTV